MLAVSYVTDGGFATHDRFFILTTIKTGIRAILASAAKRTTLKAILETSYTTTSINKETLLGIQFLK